MGTPEFAVASLEALLKSDHDLVGVITAPDKPKGRGQKLAVSPVKELALEQKLNILQPTNLKNPEFLSELQSINADLQVVVAFRMLPEAVWSMPPMGTFNLHGSLLPQYRGAAPINWAIINGEKETGVTTFFLKHEIDTGSIIMQETEPILPEDNVGTVYAKLMDRGAKLVVKTANAIAIRNVNLQPQDESIELKPAPKIFKETCEINWEQSSEAINNFIRGLNPYPAAWTKINEQSWKIYQIKLDDSKGVAGKVETDNKSFIKVHSNNGAVLLEEFQPQGKKRMLVADYLRGNKL